jgi:hypothetical protein
MLSGEENYLLWEAIRCAKSAKQTGACIGAKIDVAS